ncbi:hypothetical protein, partial [Neisseria arctica]|uniref:hypothetical protein n=1 Tax=Neisseria arctica TaxID=1470200 RepID=UPI0039C8653B
MENLRAFSAPPGPYGGGCGRQQPSRRGKPHTKFLTRLSAPAASIKQVLARSPGDTNLKQRCGGRSVSVRWDSTGDVT